MSPVDVQELGCDFYAFSGHKMLAPMGSGALWARRELLEEMPPFLAGGEMIREVHLRRSEWNDVPWKFEAGTPDVSAAIGMGAAAEYLTALGMDRVQAHEHELVVYTLDAFCARGPEVRSTGRSADRARRGGSFNVAGVHPHDVAQVLDRFGIAVRAGHHCTSRCTSAWICRPPPGRASACTRPARTWMHWSPASTKSSSSSARGSGALMDPSGCLRLFGLGAIVIAVLIIAALIS